MENQKISQLDPYSGNPDFFDIPGVADGQTLKTNLGAAIQKKITSERLLSPSDLKTVNGVPLTGPGDIALELVHPFKGWYDSLEGLQTAVGCPAVGDYAYIKGTTASDPAAIYECVTAGTWSDSGRTVDVSNVQSFASGQPVSDMAIDGTGLEDPADNALAKAADVMQLAAKLEGVTLQESKVTDWADWHPADKSTGYYNIVSGSPVWANNTNFCTTRIAIPAGTKRIRFDGCNYQFSSYVPCYGFANSNEEIMADTFHPYYDAAMSDGNDIDLIVDVPEGASYFLCLYKMYWSSSSTNHITQSKFYIYLQTGDGIKDLIPSVVNNFPEGGEHNALSAEMGKELYGELFGVTERTIEQLTPVAYSWRIGNIDSVPSNTTLRKLSGPSSAKAKGLSAYRGKKLVITNRNVNVAAYFMIVSWNSYPSSGEWTLQELVELGYLSSVHYTGDPSIGYNGWKALFEVPAYGGKVEITIPDDAFSLLATGDLIGDTSTNRDIAKLEVITETTVSEGVIKELQKVSSSGGSLAYELGNIDSDGAVVPATNKAVTGYINNGNGFYIELQNGYHVERAVLYDKDGKFLTYNYYVHNTSGHDGADNNCWGNNEQLPQFRVRLVLAPDAGAVMPSAGVVKRFVYLNDSRLSRVIPSEVDYAKFIYKLHQLTNIVWQPIEKARHNYGGGVNNTLWFLKDSVVTGVPYSTETEYSKYIGIDVSFRTFLSAVKNKRSVVYTECVETKHAKSAYGLSYHGQNGYTGNFYGSVCTGLISYILGYYVNEYVGDMDSKLGPANKVAHGQSTLSWGNDVVTMDDFAQRIQPMDIILNSGHISVISDIYKDEYGVVQYIVWAEQTGPTGRMIPYSKEMLAKRFAEKAFDLYRLPAATWQTALVKDVEDTSAIVQNSFYDYEPMEVEIDPDISTFEGEYAVFVDNADDDNTASYNNYKAFLNIHRGGGYTTLQIFDEDDVELSEAIAEYPIIGEYAWIGGPIKYIVNGLETLVYPDDAADKDDWITVDLMQLSTKLVAGKYKARVVGTGVESGFTHFQIVSISMTPTVSGSYVTRLDFTVVGGEAVAVSQQTSVMPYAIRNLTESEKLNGYVTFSGSGIGFSGSYYLKLVVKADYGTAVKRINKSSFA